MVSSLSLVLVLVVAVTSQEAVTTGQCGGEPSEVIAGGRKLSDGSWSAQDGRRYPAGCFWDSPTSGFRGCNSKVTCLWKCCPQGQTFSSKIKCTPNKHNFTTRFNVSKFHILIGNPCNTTRFKLGEDDISGIEENGTLIEKIPGSGEIYSYPAGGFCVDDAEKGTSFEFQTVALACNPNAPKNETDDDEKRDHITFLIYTVGRLIALPFLIATVAVYAVIPELRNLHGKCLVSHVTSLSVAYVFLIVVALGGAGLSTWFCIACAVIIYFSLLGSFFWLNAMCFDIWWTFSGHRQGSGMKGGNEKKQFLFYSLYAWGCPVIMLCVCLVIEFSPGVPDSYTKPEFGVKKCWFKDKLTALAYFSGPMGVLILSNIVFFAVTALNILRIKRQTSVLATADSSRNIQQHNEQRFILYVKLFVVMGVTWSIDLIGSLSGGPDAIWYLTDLANILQGVFIFIIFVCKDRVWKLLKQRFNCEASRHMSSSTLTTAVL